jgi:hypothetical protein
MTEMLSTLRHSRRSVWLLSMVIVVLVGGLVLTAINSFASPSHKTLAATTSGSSNGTASAPLPKLSVHGSSPKGLAPGVTKTVTVQIRNPRHVHIVVTAASITVGDASETCSAKKNISTSSYKSTAAGAKSYDVYVSHQARIPLKITMVDLPTNQDACKGAHFPLTFTATGRAG